MANTLVTKPEPFQIEDRTYVLRHFGFTDVTLIADLIKDALVLGGTELVLRFPEFFSPDNTEVNLSDLPTELLVLFGFDGAIHALYKFIASLLREVHEDGTKTKVTVEDLEDPDKFPIYNLVFILTEIVHHPDLSMFKNAVIANKELPFFKALLPRLKSLMKDLKIQKLN